MEEIRELFEESFPEKWERSFREFISVDPDNEHTRVNLKSQSVIKAEIFRHILFHRNVFHCYSRFRCFWENLIMINLGLSIIFIPYGVSFIYGQTNLTSEATVRCMVLIIDVVFILNIFISFNSGYYDHIRKIIVLERRNIAIHYLKTHFFIDLLSLLHQIHHLLYEKTQTDSISFAFPQCTTEKCIHDLIELLIFLKILQVPLFFRYMDNLLQRKKRSSFFIKSFLNWLAIIVYYHITVCSYFLVLRVVSAINGDGENFGSVVTDARFWNNSTDFSKYIICFFYTTYTVALFASEMDEDTHVDIIIAIFFTLAGFILHIWLVSTFFMHLRTAYAVEFKFQEIRNQLQMYMASKRLSAKIQRRTLTLYDFTFNGKFFGKRDVEESLNQKLLSLVKLERGKHLLYENYLFKQIPEDLLVLIADCLVEVSFSTNDVICRTNNARTNLYWILSGTVAVYTEDEVEIAHLRDGNMFGEIAFILQEENQSSLNYVATEESILIVLTRNDFMKVLAESPKILGELRRNVRVRINTAREMTEEKLIETLKQRGIV